MGNSFYGGQDARPFIIKKKFDSVEDMVTAFSIGLVYTDVNFEDYVLIETEHKNNPENGMIFRRGYDVNSNRYIDSYEVVSEKVNDVERVVAFVLRENDDRLKAYGAEYIGTIVGPAGGAPHLDFSRGYDEIQTIEGYKDCIEGSFKPKLVSGKTNNEIKGKWYSVRTKDNESTTVFIGFEIPYTVFDFTAKSKIISSAILSNREREENTVCKVPQCCFKRAFARGVNPLVFTSNHASIFSCEVNSWGISLAS